MELLNSLKILQDPQSNLRLTARQDPYTHKWRGEIYLIDSGIKYVDTLFFTKAIFATKQEAVDWITRFFKSAELLDISQQIAQRNCLTSISREVIVNFIIARTARQLGQFPDQITLETMVPYWKILRDEFFSYFGGEPLILRGFRIPATVGYTIQEFCDRCSCR